jgi:4-aminobutyrate aminotransferase/(S)-3-amino-2-methylpropionate transaminase
LFACEHYGIEPDLIATAKSLAAGMPLSAVTGRAEMMDAPHPGGLGGTYSGNPLACVAAVEAIKMIRQPEFLARARQVGERLREHAHALQAEFPIIGDVRGVGPMVLIELVSDPVSKTPAMNETGAITQAAIKRGLIVIRAGMFSNCIRFLPPLNITDEQIDEGMGVLRTAIAQVVGIPALQD